MIREHAPIIICDEIIPLMANRRFITRCWYYRGLFITTVLFVFSLFCALIDGVKDCGWIRNHRVIAMKCARWILKKKREKTHLHVQKDREISREYQGLQQPVLFSRDVKGTIAIIPKQLEIVQSGHFYSRERDCLYLSRWPPTGQPPVPLMISLDISIAIKRWPMTCQTSMHLINDSNFKLSLSFCAGLPKPWCWPVRALSMITPKKRWGSRFWRTTDSSALVDIRKSAIANRTAVDLPWKWEEVQTKFISQHVFSFVSSIVEFSTVYQTEGANHFFVWMAGTSYVRITNTNCDWREAELFNDFPGKCVDPHREKVGCLVWFSGFFTSPLLKADWRRRLHASTLNGSQFTRVTFIGGD